MKGAWVMIILGIVLIPEGLIRLGRGIMMDDMGRIIGGLLTGIGLGVLLLYLGINRYKHTVARKRYAKRKATEYERLHSDDSSS